MNRNIFPMLILFFGSFVIAACAMNGKNENQQLSACSSISTVTLSQRAQGRWAAMTELNMEKVFSYATPAYRGMFDLTHINNQYAGEIVRGKFNIKAIDFKIIDDECVAVISGIMDYRIKNDDILSKFKLQGDVVQKWIYEGSQWWFLEPR